MIENIQLITIFCPTMYLQTQAVHKILKDVFARLKVD